jgi:extracellular factor (EF) 3-hydroxypalmitic acid methyl ester biosynthesis protein
MSSTFLDRCFTKPRGYAGDFETIDIIYNNQPSGSGRLGPLVDNWALDLSASKAVRERRHTMKSFIYEKKNELNTNGKIPITTLACGPAREVFDILDDAQMEKINYTCIDIDHMALDIVSKNMREKKLADRIQLFKENIVRMSLNKGKTKIQPQSIIYSLGLIDYLKDKLVIKLLDWVFDNLRSGGYAVLGNFNKGNPDKPFMDYVTEWVLIHRSPEEMKELYAQSKFGKLPVTVENDDTGIQLFAFCQKN